MAQTGPRGGMAVGIVVAAGVQVVVDAGVVAAGVREAVVVVVDVTAAVVAVADGTRTLLRSFADSQGKT